MPEPFSEARLAQLEDRWRLDPGSRIFLQLAEELRRGGQIERATAILRSGLSEHPTYLSAQVSLGRCLLEGGEAATAAEVLERAVVQDPTQIVANKLLVEAYLRTGEAKRARERLDFYRLFNDRDDEILELELRIRDLIALEPESTAQPSASASRPAPFELAAPPPLPFEFAPGARSPERVAMPFGELAAPAGFAEQFAVRCRAEGLFRIRAAAPPVEAPPPVPVERPEQPPEIAELRPEAAGGTESAHLPSSELQPQSPPAPSPVFVVESSFESDQPFALPVAPEVPSPAPASPPWSDTVDAAELGLDGEATLITKPFSPRDIGAEVERETIEEPYDELFTAATTPAPVPRTAAADAASVTLGSLYLEQGHLDEAEKTFRAVVAVRPGETTAEAGLAEIARRRSTLTAADESAASWETESSPAAGPGRPLVGRLTLRKVDTLRAYLERIRQKGRARVS